MAAVDVGKPYSTIMAAVSPRLFAAIQLRQRKVVGTVHVSTVHVPTARMLPVAPTATLPVAPTARVLPVAPIANQCNTAAGLSSSQLQIKRDMVNETRKVRHAVPGNGSLAPHLVSSGADLLLPGSGSREHASMGVYVMRGGIAKGNKD